MVNNRTVIAACGVVTACLVAAGGAWAQEAAEAGLAADAAAAVDVASAYVFRGVTVSDEVSVQPSLEGTFGCPLGGSLALGTWAHLDTDSSQFAEIDLYASYTLPPSQCPVGVAIGYTEYTYPTAVTTPAEGESPEGLPADREVNLGISYEMDVADDTTASLGATLNFGVDGALEDGLYVEASAGLEKALPEDVSVSAAVTAGYVTGYDLETDDGVSHVTLTAGAAYGPLSASVSYVIEADKDVLDVDEDVYGIVGLSIPL